MSGKRTVSDKQREPGTGGAWIPLSVTGGKTDQSIPSLDGLRAVSIAMVLFAHALGTRFFLPTTVRDGWMEPGRMGVRVFFVISGYLITRLLLREDERTGRISIGHFYLRRAFRILPAFLVFLTVISALDALHYIALPRLNLFYAFTYTINFTRDNTWWTGHLWSLSVEEQFYLLWPAVVALTSRRTAKWVALAGFLVPPVLRSLVAMGKLPLLEGLDNAFPLVADELACGCLLALWEPRLKGPRWDRLFGGRLVYLVPFAVLFLSRIGYSTRRVPPPLYALVGYTAMTVCIAFAIARFTRVYGDWGGRLLNWAPARKLGVLSYSVYLWQQIFLNRNTGSSIFQTFPVNILCALTMAVISYLAVEQTFLKWRQRFRSEPARNGAPSEAHDAAVHVQHLGQDHGLGEGLPGMIAGGSGAPPAKPGIGEPTPLAYKAASSGNVFRAASGSGHPFENRGAVAGDGEAGREGLEDGDGHHFVE